LDQLTTQDGRQSTERRSLGATELAGQLSKKVPRLCVGQRCDRLGVLLISRKHVADRTETGLIELILNIANTNAPETNMYVLGSGTGKDWPNSQG
jgi:hypothetical protein